MFDSLPYRNDAAIVLRRLIRSPCPVEPVCWAWPLATRGFPAMMMALAGSHDLPCIIVPAASPSRPTDGEDAGYRSNDRRPFFARPSLP